LVTVTTDLATVDPKRLPPKSKLVSLRVAVVFPAVTASVVVAVWLREPEVAVKVNVPALELTAADAAVSMNWPIWPALRLKVAGVAVTPVGKPLTAMLTVPVKPFNAETATDTACGAPPFITETVAGPAAKVKSAVTVLELPPQPQITNVRKLRTRESFFKGSLV